MHGKSKMAGAKKAGAKKPMKYADGGKAKAFKPCPGCPTPGKCAKMGMCAAKARK